MLTSMGLKLWYKVKIFIKLAFCKLLYKRTIECPLLKIEVFDCVNYLLSISQIRDASKIV